MIAASHVVRLAGVCSLALAGCGGPAPGAAVEGGGLSGHIYWVASADFAIHKLDLATGQDVVLGDGAGVDVAPDGKLVIIGRSGIEDSDESLVTTRVIKRSNPSSTDPADVNPKYPRVSPDGASVAYQTLAQDTFVCARADGAIEARFEHTGASTGWLSPSWTPDGALVVAGGFANPGLYVSDAALTKMTRFDPNLEQPRMPAVSRDGKKVAFILKDLVYVIGIDGAGLTQLDPTTSAPADVLPTWSPDGSHVAYFAHGHLLVRPAAGGDAVDVFDVYPDLRDKLLVFSSTEPMKWTE